MGKSTGRVRYKDSKGELCPSVTTIIGLLAKPELVNWANKQGLKGIDINQDHKARDIGTIAHAKIQSYITGKEFDSSEYAPADVEKADMAFKAYKEWQNGKQIEPLLVETPLVSEVFKFGGTVDLYAKINGIPTLIDFKTSRAIYAEYRVQVSAYGKLLQENGYEVAEHHILRIDKETADFEHTRFSVLDREWEMFLHLRRLYDYKKAIWGN